MIGYRNLKNGNEGEPLGWFLLDSLAYNLNYIELAYCGLKTLLKEMTNCRASVTKYSTLSLVRRYFAA